MLLELFLVNFLRKSTLGGLPKVLKPVDISGRASMVANQRYYVAVENSSLDVDFKVLTELHGLFIVLCRCCVSMTYTAPWSVVHQL